MTKIAVAGAQTSVGREILNFLEENAYKVDNIYALEVKAPLGTMMSYGEDEDLDVFNLDDFDFSKVDVAIFATSTEISKKYIPNAVAKGVKVVDCSATYLSDENVPMIISGLNDEKIQTASRGIVMVPSASSCQVLRPLAKILEKYKVSRLLVSTYTSTSVYGKEAMDELFNQTRKIFMNDTLADTQQVFHKQIAFNVIPQVEDFIGEETACEWAINAEIKKIAGSDIKVHANCAVVPAFIGNGAFVNVECEEETDVDEIAKEIKAAKNVVVFDKHVDGGYVTLTDIQGENNVYVSRLRQDVSVKNGFSFWCVADNLRASVAQNAFDVMKLLIK